MSDDKTQAGGHDRSRISVTGSCEVRDRAGTFGVTPDGLKARGSEAAVVEARLRGSRR